MKYIIVLLFSIGLSAQEFVFICNNIDPEFQVYYDEFFQEVDERNIAVGLGDRYGSIQFDDINALGRTSNACEEGIEIRINRATWEHFGAINNWARNVIFHELGHAVFELAHICVSEPNGGCDKIEFNIMSTCSGPNFCSVSSSESYINNNIWDEGVNRFFNQIETLDCSYLNR